MREENGSLPACQKNAINTTLRWSLSPEKHIAGILTPSCYTSTARKTPRRNKTATATHLCRHHSSAHRRLSELLTSPEKLPVTPESRSPPHRRYHSSPSHRGSLSLGPSFPPSLVVSVQTGRSRRRFCPRVSKFCGRMEKTSRWEPDFKNPLNSNSFETWRN